MPSTNVKFFVKNLFHNCLTIRGINTYLCHPFEIKEGKRLLTLLVGKKKNTLEFQIQDKNYSKKNTMESLILAQDER